MRRFVFVVWCLLFVSMAVASNTADKIPFVYVTGGNVYAAASIDAVLAGNTTQLTFAHMSREVCWYDKSHVAVYSIDEDAEEAYLNLVNISNTKVTRLTTDTAYNLASGPGYMVYLRPKSESTYDWVLWKQGRKRVVSTFDPGHEPIIDACCDQKAIYYVTDKNIGNAPILYMNGRSFPNHPEKNYSISTLWKQPLGGSKRQMIYTLGHPNWIGYPDFIMSACPWKGGLMVYVFKSPPLRYTIVPLGVDSELAEVLVETNPNIFYHKTIRAGAPEKFLITKCFDGNLWLCELDIATQEQRRVCWVDSFDYYHDQ